MSSEPAEQQELLQLLREQNTLLKRQIRENTRFGMIILRGMAMGLGTALGATVVLWICIAALKPLSYIGPIRPAIERLVDRLDRLDKIAQSKANPNSPPVQDDAQQNDNPYRERQKTTPH